MADYNSSYTGIQIDTAVGKALNPDTTVAAGSSSLITSGAVASALAVKAPLASPSFTGTPTAPDPDSTSNDTQIATTHFVKLGLATRAPTVSPTFTGTPKAPTATAGTNTTQLATTAFVQAAVSGLAPISHASSATTYGKGTNSYYGHVKLSDSTSSTSSASDGVAATPAAVKAAYDLSESAYDAASGKAPTIHASSATTYGKGTNNYYGHVKLSDAINSSSSTGDGIAATPSAVKAAYDLANGKAPIASPSFTGTPTAPTATAGTNTTQIATTAFVKTANDNLKVTTVNPNLVENWYFVGGGSQSGNYLPINERGRTSYSGLGFTIDRWKTSNSNTTVSIASGGLTISASSDSTPYLLQKIMNPELLLGRTVTLSVLMQDGLHSRTDTLPTSNPSANSVYTNEANIMDILYSAGIWSVRLKGPKNGSNTYIAVKLELGNTQTFAHQENNVWVLNELPHFTEQQLQCNRYYLRLNQYVRYPLTRVTSTSFDFTIPIPVKINGIPSIENDSLFSIISGSSVVSGTYTFSVTGAGSNAVGIRAVAGSGTTLPSLSNGVFLQVSEGAALTTD